MAIRNALLCCAILVIVPSFAFCSTIHIPGDQPTIQAGIDSARNGDTVLVADGLYTGDGNRDMDFLGKAIVVTSENGPEVTVIDVAADSADPHRAFFFHTNEDSTSVLSGFTITGGFADTLYWHEYPSGGAIYVLSSSPIIEDCHFVENRAPTSVSLGGAIYCTGAWLHCRPIIRSCRFIGNSAALGGALMLDLYANAVVSDCIFADNLAAADSSIYGQVSSGGAVVTAWVDSATFRDCLFENNVAQAVADQWSLGGALFATSSVITIDRCRFEGNSVSAGWRGSWGGGIGVDGARAIITDCEFIDNTSISTGTGAGYGGAAGGLSAHFEFLNCLIVDNAVDGNGGAVEFLTGDTILFRGCTIARNHSSDTSAAIWMWGGYLGLYETIIGFSPSGGAVGLAYNGKGGQSSVPLGIPIEALLSPFNSPTAGPRLGAAIPSGRESIGELELDISCSNIFANKDGDWVGIIEQFAGVDGNIAKDPLFCDTAVGGYHVFGASPCAPVNNRCRTLIGALDIGCGNSIIEPDTMFVAQEGSIESLEAIIYIGSFHDVHDAGNIDPSSLLVNGTIVPSSTFVVPSHPDFAGEVMRISVSLADFIRSYGIIWGTTEQTYLVSGSFDDGSTFSVPGTVTIIGHRSGDLNVDSVVDITDLTSMTDYLFVDGPAPDHFELADVDGSSGQPDIADLTCLIDYLFGGGPPPTVCP